MFSTLVRSILGDAAMTPELVEKLDAISLEELGQKSVGVIGTLKKNTQSHTAPEKPKRPTSAYLFWLKGKRAYITKTVDEELAKSGETVTGSVRNTIVLQTASSLWKTTSDKDKEAYIAMFLKDQERYQTEMAAFKGPVEVVKRPRGRPKGSKNKLKVVSPPKTGDDSVSELAVPIKRGRGRPKGSKNKPKVADGEVAGETIALKAVEVPKRGRGRPKGSKNKPKVEVPNVAENEVEGEIIMLKPVVDATAPPKRGRGRPKGSKNKPKAVTPTN
jgi:hypothetical protein